MEITIKANPTPKVAPTDQRCWPTRLAPARQPRTEALRRVAIAFLAEGFLIIGWFVRFVGSIVAKNSLT